MESPIDLEFEDIKGQPTAKKVRFIGEIDATNYETVWEKICALFAEGVTTIVADFKKLRYVNSTGLGILLQFSKSAKEKGGSFKIANVNENVYEIIEIIGATTVLEIYDDIEEAITALK